ncbi:hypothetical protein [Arsenicitalea aurantiaca]|uniref:hypothetical protein n=1 Tax=Arsenicitalea aurantiaca TaxID=1783274 RepID=UPI0013156B3B|nr:hypothetical protein [Arsenicitalea aurantiaca]
MAALAACSSFTPAYGPQSVAEGRLALAYAAPNNRLEQVIYQDLALRLGPGGDTGAPRVSVTARSDVRRLARSRTDNPRTEFEAVVTADLVVTEADGAVSFTATRSASAVFTRGEQVLADVSAETEAAERAARAVAETLRLTLLGALATAQ